MTLQEKIEEFREARAKKSEELLKKILDVSSTVPLLKGYPELTGDWIVTHDWHVPFCSDTWIKRLFKVANLYNISRHLIAGDLFDMTSFSHFVRSSSSEKGGEWELGKAGKIVCALLENFDENVFTSGNHDRRIFNMLCGNISLNQTVSMVLQEKTNIQTYEYPYAIINGKKAKINGKDQYIDGWLVCHPRNYSRITTRVPVTLAGKFNMNVISAHGHHFGFSYSDDGRYICIDGGGMMDLEKTAYIMYSMANNPHWQNGFTIVKNNHAHFFHERMDWNRIMKAKTLGDIL